MRTDASAAQGNLSQRVSGRTARLAPAPASDCPFRSRPDHSKGCRDSRGTDQRVRPANPFHDIRARDSTNDAAAMACTTRWQRAIAAKRQGFSDPPVQSTGGALVHTQGKNEEKDVHPH